MIEGKMKKQKVSNYQKALDRMERETARAIAHVEQLSKMYAKLHTVHTKTKLTQTLTK